MKRGKALMKPRSQVLNTLRASHMDLLRAEQTRTSEYITELEELIEEYREFISRAKFTTMSDQGTQFKLLRRTNDLIGLIPEQQPEGGKNEAETQEHT
jgi:hypothetical protein